ncbi:MAG TPA: alpha/beta hydrolase [Parafilimonas sp.]|nr:alpha/beta hydrolase [Parafilimonas sp.]
MSILCFDAGAADIIVGYRDFDSLLNVAYGEDPAQRMDIYLPTDHSLTQKRVLILLHGGGWSSGSRHSFSAYIDSFKIRLPGYAIFNVDYRLVSQKIHFTDQEADIKTAVDFIVSRAGEYNIDTGKFVLMGVSAGAHLALLQAYKNASPGIAAVIDFFGPADLNAMYRKPWNPMIPDLMKLAIGGTPQTSSLYHDLSPVSFIQSGTPPTLILHGKRDYVVDISQSELLQQRLEQAGVKNRLVVYPDAGHGWRGNTLSDSFDAIEAFLQGK